MDISKLFKFNKWAYVNLAKEIRKASWFSSVVLSYAGFSNNNVVVFIFTIVIWIGLQLCALIVESFHMDEETDKGLPLSNFSTDETKTGESNEHG